VAVAQLVRAPGCGPGGRGFKSPRSPSQLFGAPARPGILQTPRASSSTAEQRTLNPQVLGSNPRGRTGRKGPGQDRQTSGLATAVEAVPGLRLAAPFAKVRKGRSRVLWEELRITVDSSVSESKRVKGPKTRRQRSFHVDADTMAILRRVCDEMDERAVLAGGDLCADPYVFSLALDCSQPIPPDYLTKRVGVLKGHLGIEDKRPGTIEMENEALRLRRQPPRPRPPGPAPQGGMSFREIGEQLGRSERWEALAVQAAERRQNADLAGLGKADYDGSILALRKFTSTELLDAGFNISMVPTPGSRPTGPRPSLLQGPSIRRPQSRRTLRIATLTPPVSGLGYPLATSASGTRRARHRARLGRACLERARQRTTPNPQPLLRRPLQVTSTFAVD
jgi:hypothetical protein